MTYLVGLQGVKGVGKTTTANFLKNHFNGIGLAAEVDSFATPVYEIASVLTGESVDDIKLNKTKQYSAFDKHAPSVSPVFWGMTRRGLLQQIGTEVFRESFNHDVWASILCHRLSGSASLIVVVDDNRFQNEVEYLDLTIRIKRKLLSDGVGDFHPSENQEIECDHEFDLDNKDLNELAELILYELGLDQWTRDL